MHRRTFLGSAGAVGAASGLAGCLGLLNSGDSNPNVVLDEPDRDFDSSDIPYPAWGQQLPDVTLPAPIDSRGVRLRDVEGPALLTFFYSHCQSVCPVLLAAQRSIQAHALDNGYDDVVSFLPITFDPARDTADRLRTYATEMNIDRDHENWQFLRPASRERAKAVVEEQFGVAFERTEPAEMDTYMFTHSALTLLANDGFVERAYRSKRPDTGAIIEDLETVRTA
jgi:protein SCO1/2